jgi:HD-GYP domain-containing protein (c-di-GMP phosphodiesterase class II)
LDLAFDLRNAFNKEIITVFVQEHRNTFFPPVLSDVFLKIADHQEFWEALSDKNIDDNLKKVIPIFSNELNFNEIRTITKTLSKIIDAKSEYTQTHSSGLSEKLEKMAEFYKMDTIMTSKLLIA